MEDKMLILILAVQGTLAVMTFLYIIFMFWYWYASKKENEFVIQLEEQGLDYHDLRSFMAWLGYVLRFLVFTPILIPVLLISKIVDRVKEDQDSNKK